MKRRIFVDTEWTAPPWSEQSELMWIGLADEGGRSWYGISSEVEIDPSTNDFISGAFRLIAPDEPRMSRAATRGSHRGLLRPCGRVLGVDPDSREVRGVVQLGRRSIGSVRPVLEHRSSDASGPCESLATRLAQPLARPQCRCSRCRRRDSTQGRKPPSSTRPCRMESETVRTHPRDRQTLKVSARLEQLMEVHPTGAHVASCHPGRRICHPLRTLRPRNGPPVR